MPREVKPGAKRTVSVLVEKAERLLEFSNLFFRQLISHGSLLLCNKARGFEDKDKILPRS